MARREVVAPPDDNCDLTCDPMSGNRGARTKRQRWKRKAQYTPP